jgi:hypothetical protein
VIITPPDVIEMALFELWPREWRKSASGSRNFNDMKKHHARQRRRIHSVSGGLSRLANNSFPLLALHQQLAEPVVLD